MINFRIVCLLSTVMSPKPTRTGNLKFSIYLEQPYVQCIDKHVKRRSTGTHEFVYFVVIA